MAIVHSDFAAKFGGGYASSITFLRANLDPKALSSLRRLTHVLRPPIDAPRALEATSCAIECVKVFGKTISQPSDCFEQLIAEFDHLATVIALIKSSIPDADYIELSQPLYRRLSRYPGWALCISLTNSPEGSLFKEAAGVEIAYSYAVGKTFPGGYAADLRRELENLNLKPCEIPHDKIFAFSRHHQKALRAALVMFEADTTNNCEGRVKEDGVISFEDEARNYFFRNQKYARPNHRRGVLDSCCQSIPQLTQSAKELHDEARKGNDGALVTILAFCIGISAELIIKLPLINSAPDNWLMVIDVEEGLVKVNLDPLFPDAAMPEPGSVSSHRPANRVIVKPLPAFVSRLLIDRLSKFPRASTLGSLLPYGRPEDVSVTCKTNSPGIAASRKRFLDSAAPYCIQHGIDRLVVAAITNDFSVIPGGKPYYAQVSREEIWAASERVFGSLGWGEPVAVNSGLAAGSRIAPTREAVSSLFAWMTDELASIKPGKKYTLKGLIGYHNSYTKYCATLTILCLASRKVENFKFTSSDMMGDGSYVPISDKSVGQFPGQMPVPMNDLLRKQMSFFHTHCASFDRKLEKLQVPSNSKLRIALKQIINCDNAPLFWLVSESLSILKLGTADLVDWWPEPQRFKGNFARSFWQVELRNSKLKSSIIDLFVRHQLLGCESLSSNCDKVLESCFQEICGVQLEVLSELGISPAAGLGRK